MRKALLLVSLLAAVGMLAVPRVSFAEVALSITIAPPALPVYEQPPCPAPGYMWTPGYWAWSPDGYYWVPGTWVQPPMVGFLWTPGYWGWSNGIYLWNAGYWGPQIGFYGGVVYGFGYDGVGFEGGYWQGSQFYYNTSVTNVNVTVVRNVYRRPVVVRNANAVSYNGGPGGIAMRPTREQEMAARERHVAPTSMQLEQEHAARSNPDLRASFNHGHPPIAATARPGAFKGHDVVAARGAPGLAEHGAPKPAYSSATNHERQVVRPPASAAAPKFTPSTQHPPAKPASGPEPHYTARTTPTTPHPPEQHYQHQPASSGQYAHAPAAQGEAAPKKEPAKKNEKQGGNGGH